MKTIDQAEHARQVVSMKVFAKIAKNDPNTQRDTGQFFLSTYTHLDSLCKEHTDIIESYELSRFKLVLQSDEKSLAHRLAKLSFDPEEYLSELKLWLNTESDAQLLTVEDLSVFLQIARTGRRTFQANGHDPEYFLDNDTYWLATIFMMALMSFPYREIA